MYLSKIELFGFKSFAHKVRIKFDKGLTAIVGPNGCGKTNIVDAIRWVLGEQKSSLLRSAKMENIIFNGSKNLKPLSITEVSLTIENTRNVLPIEYTEVTVTRRLYRNGESEVLLNQVPCRLKDILDLFTDTGMGSDAYSVIELKMIEEIISNKSEERLKLFEEAAGISRYKQRRKQTFKLLESTSRDLSRVDDILAEVEKKVKSLKFQVRKAEKLRELKKKIREIDLELSWHTMEHLRELLEPMQQRLREMELLNQACATKIATEDSITQETELLLLKQEQELSETQKRLNDINQRIHTFDKELLQHEENKKNLAAESARIKSDITKKEEKYRDQELLENSLLQRQPSFEKACSELYAAFQSLVAEHDELNATLGERREELAHERRLSIEEQSIANHLALTKHTLESKKEYLRTTIESLEAKKLTAQKKMRSSHQAEKILLDEINCIKERITKAKISERLLREQLDEVSRHIEKKQEAFFQYRSERDKVSNQILLANSVLDNFEGMPEGIGFLEKQKNGKQWLGCLSDLVSLDSSYQKAVNAALGDSMSYYVCQSLEEAKEGIASLTRSNKGKVHFLVLDLVTNGIDVDYPDINGTEKTLEVIDYPPELYTALRLILGKSYIVPDLRVAETLALKYPDSSFVTSDGEKFIGNGLLFGGSSKSSEGLRLGKKSLRDRLQKELFSFEKTINKEEDALQQLRNKLKSINVAAPRLEIEQLALELGTLEKKAARLDAEQSACERELEQVGLEKEKMVTQKAACEAELNALLPEISSKTSKASLFSEKIKLLQENLTTLETRHHLFGREVQARQNRYKDAHLDLEKLSFNIASCAENRRSMLDEINKLNTEGAATDKKRDMVQETSERIKKELDKLFLMAAAKQQTVTELELVYREKQSQHRESQTKLRELRRKHEIDQQQLASITQERMQLQQSLDHLFTETQVKHNCDLALIAEPDNRSSFERGTAQQKLDLLTKEREQFGAVNELAMEEYEGEKKRLDFLSEQKEDLLNAEKQLRSTIDEINKTALQKFEATFSDVRKNFITIFRELFDPEDEVDLLIHTDEDPLDAHIEIVAKPRGKKPLSIEQLSGGEKALTALSLLFAIYLVKPSPFCILDEVDAPLDDANVTRFIKLLKKFENNTQFIIVTHNKKTMASCQALYGVTMEEDGVSKLIPVRLEKIRI
ncbi:MAG: chromosome segregation protein SMC [Chlorobiaceae bacterium]|nr:chromosome segregation protein SMC [Chlorobiaceae bacterium]NTV16133.1 chromosome segregation protein SMC [Chlorobiaceae bacterium]